jgi:hypothetical protein
MKTIMKRHLITALSFLALGLTSCADFLDTKPQGSPTSETYFSNDYQAVQWSKGLYYQWSEEWLFGRDLMFDQVGANDMVLGRAYSELHSRALLTVSGDDKYVPNIYNGAFLWLTNAQWGVQKLEEKKAEKGLTEIETRTLGEAYFFRAMYHYPLAVRHGLGELGVPYKPWEEYEGGYKNEIPLQLPSVVDNYLYIISDLKKAEEYLPWGGSIMTTYGPGDRGRAHKASALGYQAKFWAYIATWKKEYQERNLDPWKEVEEIVNRLEKDYGRGLNESFSDLWSSDFEKFWNKECIFSVTGNGGDIGCGGSLFPGACLENQGWGVYNGWGQFKPTYDIYAEMAKDNWEGVDPKTGKEIKNERLAKSIWEYGDYMIYNGQPRLYYSQTDEETGLAIAKYFDAFTHADFVKKGYVNASGNWPTTRVNFHMLRFADLMLLRAEACLHLYGYDKYNDIAKVHKRSTGGDFKGEASWADLYHERRCELAFEMTGHLEDIKRWTVMGYQGQDIGVLRDVAYNELMSHPKVFHAQLSPMYGLITDADGNYIDADKDGKFDSGPLYVKVAKKKDGTWDISKEYDYTTDDGTGKIKKERVTFDGVDEYGNGLVGGVPVAYYGQRNNPGAKMVVGPYDDYNVERPEWSDYMIAIPYPSSEITRAGGLYKQVPR